MYPYIAALILLIIVILYQVYASTETFTTRDASGNSIAVSADASGNEVKLSLSDLFGLLGPFKTKEVTESAPVKETIKEKAPAETVPTATSAKEIEERIVKAVSKQVKDDLLAQRSTDEVHDKYAPCDLSDAEAQGQEYANSAPKPSSQPDMSEYIRKDSIPCWNCAVP